MKGYPIKINEIEQTEKTELADKDLIGIGEFILLFSNPETQKEVVARFLQEARAVVSLRSEHVARVIDVGTLDSGAPYTIMEHLEGKDLDDLLEADGVLDVQEAVDYVLQACEAIAEAHQCSIVHRDLKPANLFLTTRADGTALVKVLDFGIAKALDAVKDDGQSGLTVTGTALGTPVYMSPEQVRDATDVDGRTDIWGLGTTLHHLLCGKPPFEANTVPALCAKIIADQPPSLSELRPEVPTGLAAVVARCLEKERDDRYPTVAELALDLARFAAERSLVSVDRVARITDGPKLALTGGRVSRGSMADTVASTPGMIDVAEDAHRWPPSPVEAATGGEQAQTQNAAVLTQTTPSSRVVRRRSRLASVAGLATLVVFGVALLWIAPWASHETAPGHPAATSNGSSTLESDATALDDPPVPSAAASVAASTSPSASSSAVAHASASVTTVSRPGSLKPRGQARTAGSQGPRPAPPPPPRPTGNPIDPLQDRR